MIAGITPGTAHQGFLAGKAATSDPLQQTEYTYDSAGRLTGILSNGAPIVSYQYDGLGRPIQKTFGNGMIAMISYDTAGRLSDITFSGVPLVGNPAIRSQTSEVSAQNPTSSSHLPTSTPSLDLQYQWDSANQLTSRTWNGQTQLYAYDPSGQLLSVTDGNSKALLESYAYDKAGNMTGKAIAGQKISMAYDAANQLVATGEGTNTPVVQRSVVGVQTSEGSPVASSPPTAISQLPTSTPAPAAAQTSVFGTVVHEDSPDTPSPSTTPTVAASTPVPATPEPPTTAPASSPSTSQPFNSSTSYSYDRAGRLIHTPGGPTRSYGWLDKVVSLTTPDGQTIHYSYWPDGQLAAKQAGNGDLQEHFLWDGLALIRRNDTIYIIEPHPSGGVPIASHPVDDPKEITWYLNDLLGSTLATVDHSGVHLQNMTTYGQQLKVADTITKVPTTPTGVSGVTIPNPVPATPTFPSKL